MIPKIREGRGYPAEEKAVPKWECSSFQGELQNLRILLRARDELLPPEFDVADSHVRSQFIFSVPVILERFSQPAAGRAISIAVHIANTGIRAH
jgi:hypothetical protein